MVVERISFRGGLPLVRDEDPNRTIVGAVERGVGSLSSMHAGEYDITPPEMTYNKYNYNLIVKPDGTGVCRMIPVFPNSGTMNVDGSDPRLGGRQVPIVQGFPSMIIAGPSKSGAPLIYECLFYSPGRSPRG